MLVKHGACLVLLLRSSIPLPFVSPTRTLPILVVPSISALKSPRMTSFHWRGWTWWLCRTTNTQEFSAFLEEKAICASQFTQHVYWSKSEQMNRERNNNNKIQNACKRSMAGKLIFKENTSRLCKHKRWTESNAWNCKKYEALVRENLKKIVHLYTDRHSCGD